MAKKSWELPYKTNEPKLKPVFQAECYNPVFQAECYNPSISAEFYNPSISAECSNLFINKKRRRHH